MTGIETVAEVIIARCGGVALPCSVIIRWILVLIPGAIPLLVGASWFGVLLLNSVILSSVFAPTGVAWIVYGATIGLNMGGMVIYFRTRLPRMTR